MKSCLKNQILRLLLSFVIFYGVLYMGACMGGGVSGGAAGGGPIAGPGGGPGALSGQSNAANPDGNNSGDGNFVPPSPTGIPSADPTPTGTAEGTSYSQTVLCNDILNNRQLVRVEGTLYELNQCWQNCCNTHEVMVRLDSENFSEQTTASVANGLNGYFIFDNLNIPKNAVLDFYVHSKGLWIPLTLIPAAGPFCGGPNGPTPANLPPPPGNCNLGNPGGGTQT